MSDDDLLAAMREMHACLRPGGCCLITKGVIKPYGVREAGDTRYIIFQVWDWDEDFYDFTLYVVEENRQDKNIQTHAMGSRYYAIRPNQAVKLMQVAGCIAVKRLDEVFFQPMLMGTKSS